MPIVISNDLVLSAQNGLIYPLTHARIGYHSYLDETNISSVFTNDDGHPLTNILTGQTFETYKKTGFAATIIVVDLGSAMDVDYLGLSGKNCSSILLEYSNDGVTYTQASVINDSSQKAKMLIFDTINARYWNIYLGGDNSSFDIGNIKLGLVLTMQRPIYGGHSPMNLNRVTNYKPNISEGGEFVGRSIVRRGLSGNFDYQNLEATWYRGYFDPFVKYARTGTYYMAWRPETFPLEVGYGWTNQDFSPSNMGLRDLMQVSWGMEVYDAS